MICWTFSAIGLPNIYFSKEMGEKKDTINQPIKLQTKLVVRPKPIWLWQRNTKDHRIVNH